MIKIIIDFEIEAILKSVISIRFVTYIKQGVFALYILYPQKFNITITMTRYVI